MLKFIKKHFFIISLCFLILIYLFTRLYNLVILPVFVDEAIYIYWSQLIISDWSRYLFYPLNDGKTPLFIWLLTPLLKIFSDPLIAGRLLSIIFGLGQLFLMIKTMSLFTKKKWLQLLAGLLMILTPGFILTNRLALIDTQLTFFLTASFYFAYLGLTKIDATTGKTATLNLWLRLIVNPSTLFSGVFFALALLTKFSAILFLPVLAALVLFFLPKNLSQIFNFSQLKKFKPKIWLIHFLPIINLLVPLFIICLIGFLGLTTLKISPAFGQIFARGGDFLYSIGDFFKQPFAIINTNLQLFSQIISNYLTSILALFSLLLAFFVWRQDRRPLFLFLCGIAFLFPILLLGKVIYPRYLLPALPFFIFSFCLSLAQFYHRKFLPFKIILLSLIFLIGIYFCWASLFEPAKMLLVPKDQEQYLTDWSSGYGIRETVGLLEEISRDKKTLVLTEGHIGTLPDGLQIYFFNRDSRNNLRIEGIGQPIVSLEKQEQLIEEYEQVVLVVNSNRLQMELSPDQLLADYTRPIAGAASLQVWSLK